MIVCRIGFAIAKQEIDAATDDGPTGHRNLSRGAVGMEEAHKTATPSRLELKESANEWFNVWNPLDEPISIGDRILWGESADRRRYVIRKLDCD